jgi:hypothetical protein
VLEQSTQDNKLTWRSVDVRLPHAGRQENSGDVYRCRQYGAGILNKVIQSLWVGSDLSSVELLCARSFLHHGHELHLYCYEPLANVPTGVVLKDANEVLPASSIYRSRDGRLSSFSNYFRWTLLSKRGGIWTDMDMVCLRPFDFDDDIVYAYEADGVVNTAVLKFPPNHFLPRVMAMACDDVNQLQPYDTLRSAIKKTGRKLLFGKERSRIYTSHTEPGGPYWYTRFLHHFGMMDLAKPREWFYPIPFWEWKRIYYPDDEARDAIKNSYAIHLWNGTVYKEDSVDKNKLNLTDTLIGELHERYS